MSRTLLQSNQKVDICTHFAPPPSHLSLLQWVRGKEHPVEIFYNENTGNRKEFLKDFKISKNTWKKIQQKITFSPKTRMWAVDWLLPGCLVIAPEDTDFFTKTRLLFAWWEMENICLQSKNWAPLSHTFQKAQLLRRPLPWKTKGNFCNVQPEQLPGNIWCSIYVFATTNQLFSFP